MVSKIITGDCLSDLYGKLKKYTDDGWVKVGKTVQVGRRIRCQIIRESNYEA